MERREAAVSKAMPKPCGAGNYGSKIRPNDKLNLRQAPYSYIVPRKTSEYCPGYKKPNLFRVGIFGAEAEVDLTEK